jgi:hypothetical protein
MAPLGCAALVYRDAVRAIETGRLGVGSPEPALTTSHGVRHAKGCSHDTT